MAARTRTEVALWILQGLLAALFLFAGGVKLVMPAEALEAQSGFSAQFLRVIAVFELLGACGLILPGLLRTYQELTPLAASGLVAIMVGATVTSAATLGPAAAVLPFVTGTLATIVAYGRWRLASSARQASTRTGSRASVA